MTVTGGPVAGSCTSGGCITRTALFILLVFGTAVFTQVTLSWTANSCSKPIGFWRMEAKTVYEDEGSSSNGSRGKMSLVGRQQGLDKESHKEATLCQSLKILFPIKPVGEPQLRGILAGRPPRDGPYQPEKADIMNTLFFGSDPYVGLVAKDVSVIQRSYVSTAVANSARLQQEIVKALGRAPKLMLEVGAFVGNSVTNTWGPLMKKSGGHVICVDTWEGDINMRLGAAFQGFMKMKNGFPTLYNLFQDNVVAAGLTSTVFPLALPSIVGARTFAALKWEFDAIYLDSAHEAGETMVEMHLYYGLLKPGGLLIGDDWDYFPAVRNDVKRFAECQRLKIQLPAYNTFMLQKPA